MSLTLFLNGARGRMGQAMSLAAAERRIPHRRRH